MKENNDAWMVISLIANCNKVMQMKLKDAVSEIAAANKGFTTVDVDETVKRIGGRLVKRSQVSHHHQKREVRRELKRRRGSTGRLKRRQRTRF